MARGLLLMIGDIGTLVGSLEVLLFTLFPRILSIEKELCVCLEEGDLGEGGFVVLRVFGEVGMIVDCFCTECAVVGKV